MAVRIAELEQNNIHRASRRDFRIDRLQVAEVRRPRHDYSLVSAMEDLDLKCYFFAKPILTFVQRDNGDGYLGLVRTRSGGAHVKDFRKAWHAVCCRAALAQLLCPQCPGEDGERFSVVENRCAHCVRKWRSDEVTHRGLLFSRSPPFDGAEDVKKGVA